MSSPGSKRHVMGTIPLFSDYTDVKLNSGFTHQGIKYWGQINVVSNVSDIIMHPDISLLLLILTSACSSVQRGPFPFLRLMESRPNRNTRSEDLDSRRLRLVCPFVGCMRHFPAQLRKVFLPAI
jgi:hypothetical protein